MTKYKKSITIVCLIIIISISLIGCKTTLERIGDYLNNNNYTSAVNLIKKIQNDADKTKAIEMLKEKADEIEESYLSGEVDGTRAIADLQSFKDITALTDVLSEKTDKINSLMNSRKAFLDGERAEKENEYASAYEAYYNVLPIDKDDYDKAQVKLVELENTLKSLEPLSITDTKITIVSKNNKEIYPDTMQVILKNHSNKLVNNFTLSILGYDANGNSVEIQSKYGKYSVYEFIGTGENISIKPGQTWGDGYGWSLSSTHNVKNIIACIQEIRYSDGTSWKNPLYKSWIEKIKQSN
jgi:hypothetical protein